MSATKQATVCLIASPSLHVFRRALDSVLGHTPADRIELRLAFSQAADSLAYAVGALAPDGAWLKREELGHGMERFEWPGAPNLAVRAWSALTRLSRERLAGLMACERPLETEYAIFLDSGMTVETGWWAALAPLLDQHIDYLGRPAWRDYQPGEIEQLHSYAWFLGVPPARRDGRPGVSYMTGGFLAIRAERLRQVDFTHEGFTGGSDVLLGAAAHQLRWTQTAHDAQVHAAE